MSASTNEVVGGAVDTRLSVAVIRAGVVAPSVATRPTGHALFAGSVQSAILLDSRVWMQRREYDGL